MPEPWKNRVKKRCAFRPRFFRIFKIGRIWDPKLETKIAVLGTRRNVESHFWGLEIELVFTRPFRTSQGRFWSPQGSILEPPGIDLEGSELIFGDICQWFFWLVPAPASTKQQERRKRLELQIASHETSSTEWEAAVLPPPGGLQ